ADDRPGDGRLARPLRADGRRRSLRAVQGLAALRQPDNPAAARLPRRSHSKRGQGDVGKGNRPLGAAVVEGEWNMADQHGNQTGPAEAAPHCPARRRFLRAGLAGAGATLAGSLLPPSAAAALLPIEMTTTGPEDIPRKPLGRTGEQVSILGLGGYHLGTVRS